MKRRDAIKRIGYAAGFVVVTPTVLGILNSCTTASDQWTPEFLSPKQGRLLTKLVDIFLPKTEQLPSANELNVPEFIDRYVNEVYLDKDQLKFKTAFGATSKILKEHSGKTLDDVEEIDLKKFLDKYLKVKGEIDEERLAKPSYKGLTTSEFLNTIKLLSIKAYLLNEKIGEDVLAYDPVPGAFYCGDLQELTGGRSWSLDSN